MTVTRFHADVTPSPGPGPWAGLATLSSEAAARRALEPLRRPAALLLAWPLQHEDRRAQDAFAAFKLLQRPSAYSDVIPDAFGVYVSPSESCSRWPPAPPDLYTSQLALQRRVTARHAHRGENQAVALQIRVDAFRCRSRNAIRTTFKRYVHNTDTRFSVVRGGHSLIRPLARKSTVDATLFKHAQVPVTTNAFLTKPPFGDTGHSHRSTPAEGSTFGPASSLSGLSLSGRGLDNERPSKQAEGNQTNRPSFERIWTRCGSHSSAVSD
ncbi:hypothetical protein EIP91_010779 [Steccherinum ochraceum]|uniref:Uncharacterized protein n=1 Tax=Steccherinum ochraceum TaxID=92696 RepID=A0A4R0R2R8_9APHY|nr:hypothetical protein EIP91_010779 [Steccherinum ochraceum]